MFVVRDKLVKNSLKVSDLSSIHGEISKYWIPELCEKEIYNLKKNPDLCGFSQYNGILQNIYCTILYTSS